MMASTQKPKDRFQFKILGVALLLLFALPVVCLMTAPEWEIEANNRSDGLELLIYRAGFEDPTYEVFLKDKKIDQDLLRQRIKNLPEDAIEILFVDDSPPPGRFTFMIAETKIDVMRSRLVVDDETELEPNFQTAR